MEEIKKEPVTAILILANVVVFLLVELTGGTESAEHMAACGAAYTPWILTYGEWYRIFTSMFLHFGIRHLVNNMLILFVLGQRLEPVVGKIRFLLIYLLGGVGGNLLSLYADTVTNDYAISAGASGAVFAVMGALIFLLIRYRGRVADLSARQILILAAFSLYFGFASSGVNNIAHVGGLVFGFLLAAIVGQPS